MFAILGAGSFGTALATSLSAAGHSVRLWARSKHIVDEINTHHTNMRYLPGVPIDPELFATDDMDDLRSSDAVVIAVPSQAMRQVCRLCVQSGLRPSRIIHAVKGLELETHKRMSEVLLEEWPVDARQVAVLSGPSHAEELAAGHPTTLVAASASRQTAEFAQNLFMSDHLRVYTQPDLVGVELGGALKNIIALGCGIADGLGFGANAKAALMTRGLAEITRLGVRLGAVRSTFLGLAGVGDLIVTCTSGYSRNWRTGFLLGQGRDLSTAMREVGMVVEGVATTRAAVELADRLDVSMPIAAALFSVLFEGRQPVETVGSLMRRAPAEEWEEGVEYGEHERGPAALWVHP